MIASDAAPWLRGPAPYPPEWQWLRREPPAIGPVWPALLVAGAVLGLLALSDSARVRASRRAAGGLVGGAVVLGFAFQLAVLRLEPEGALQALLNQAVYRTATSYFTVATTLEARDPLTFLRRHHELLPELRKTGKHASTHPPGGVLYFRGLIALFERAPALTRVVLDAAGFDDVNPRRPRPRHSGPERAAALAGGLLFGLLGAATAWPIASFARHVGAPPPEAARLALLWALLPGPVLMTPMLDQALCLPVASATACLAGAAVSSGPRRWRGAIGAGLWGGVAVFLSYGAPVFLAVGGVAALALAPNIRRASALAALAAAVTAGLWVVPAALGHRPLASLGTALAIHRQEYTLPRGYTLWLAFNAVVLALFLGVPVAAAWLTRPVRAFISGSTEAPERMRRALALAVAALLLSGQTRGEVGRIWLPLMPVLLVAALPRPTRGEALAVGAGVAVLTLVMAAFWQVP